MADYYPIPEIHSLGRFVQLFTGTAGSPNSLLSIILSAIQAEKSEDEHATGSEGIPIPDEEEIYPNREVPEEEEYLPNEEEVVIEEPPKEINDPYFPRKGDDLPPEEEEEFPQTDPV